MSLLGLETPSRFNFLIALNQVTQSAWVDYLWYFCMFNDDQILWVN